jgi:hypothetical protein
LALTWRSGIWTEWVEELGFDLKNGKITIHGEGAATLSTTSLEDVVRFAVHVLIHLPRAQLENAQFQIEGDRVVGVDPYSASRSALKPRA